MKTAVKIITGLVLLLLLYFGSYWVLMRKGYLSWLINRYGHHYEFENLAGGIQSFFQPARELDCRLVLDPTIKRALMGRLQGSNAKDFVTLTPTGECEFQLGSYHGKGLAEYHREAQGYYLLFEQDGERYKLSLEAYLFFDDKGSDALSASIATDLGLFPSMPVFETKLTKIPGSR